MGQYSKWLAANDMGFNRQSPAKMALVGSGPNGPIHLGMLYPAQTGKNAFLRLAMIQMHC
jgi:hypothetical protein